LSSLRIFFHFIFFFLFFLFFFSLPKFYFFLNFISRRSFLFVFLYANRSAWPLIPLPDFSSALAIDLRSLFSFLFRFFVFAMTIKSEIIHPSGPSAITQQRNASAVFHSSHRESKRLQRLAGFDLDSSTN
jgi:hypothetical protein